MKDIHVVILVLFVLVVLMVAHPQKTTTQITTGEQGAVDVGSAVFGGFFTPRRKRKGG